MVHQFAGCFGYNGDWGGAAQPTHWLATMGIPSMSENTFAATEMLLGDAMKRAMIEEMIESGKLQLEMAIEQNDAHQGVPATTILQMVGGLSEATNTPTM